MLSLALVGLVGGTCFGLRLRLKFSLWPVVYNWANKTIVKQLKFNLHQEGGRGNIFKSHEAFLQIFLYIIF